MKQLRILALTIAALFAVGSSPFVSGSQAQSSNTEQEVLKVRREWYVAYFRGDTATLARIETNDFVVISDRTIENKREYAGIQKAVQANRWLPKGAEQMDDDDLQVRLQGDLTVISGKGWTKVPGFIEKPPQNKTAFTEIWVRRDGRWRIMHLHYHQQGQPQQPNNAQSQTAAPAQGQVTFPVGTYTAKDQQGTWVMDFKIDGTVTVKRDDFSLAPDITYTVKNDQLEISAGTTSSMCSGKGTYKWAFDGKALSFQLVSDPNCQPRQAVMTGNKFIKQP